MKLTKLYIHNYKSFYDTTIELDKLNIVVGENNSGKSNLIDVLEFIQLSKNTSFENAISQKAGFYKEKLEKNNLEDVVFTKNNLFLEILEKSSFEKILNYNNNEKRIILEFELENLSHLVRIRYTIEAHTTVSSIIIFAKLDKKIVPLVLLGLRKTNGLEIIEKNYQFKKNILAVFEENENLVFDMYDFYITLSFFSTIYAFHIEKIRNDSHRKADKELQKDGSNLGHNLLHIKDNYPNSFNIISNSMIGVVNEIKGIDVQELFGNALIGFKERNQEIGIDMVSDGTINLLATITALNQDEDKSILLAFDEPERYLHMKAVHYLMDAFRSSKKQILITTHSTEILKYADLSEVIFIYRDSDGDTQSIRANEIPNLKEKMEHMTFERSMTLDEMLDEDMVWDFE